MNVLHILANISGTTIPVEIASATDKLPDTKVRLVSNDPLPDILPDTVDNYQILENLCGFDDFGALLNEVTDTFEIVHTHTVAEAATVGYHAHRHPVHHVNTQHGHPHYTVEEKWKNLPGLALADTIIYNSWYTANSYNIFEKLLKSRASEHVVHNGVNVKLVEPYRASIETPPTIITATRLIERKNIATLIRALSRTDKMNLRIVGDGPHRDTLERTAQDAGVESRTEFLGYLPHREDVYEELAGADVFALPSHGEGFCVAAAEAMAVGLPVVISNIPIFHEVVGENGVFVDQNSPRNIAWKLEELFSDIDRARQLGERNHDRIMDRFTLDRCARGYRSVYNSILQ